MKKILLFLLLVFVCGQEGSAQVLAIDSTRFITGLHPFTGINFAIPTSDKGILFVGSDAGNPGGIIPFFPIDTVLNNVLIGKIDSNHQVKWIKIFGGSDYDLAFGACETSDGGYAVLATTESDNGDVTGYKGGVDMWLLRIDTGGNLLWEKTYGSSLQDAGISIANTPDHGFIMLGITYGSDGDVPFHYGDMSTDDWLVVKTDSVGTVQWSKDLGGTGNEYEGGTIISVDSSYYLLGTSGSTDHDCTDSAWHSGVYTGDDFYILKLDTTGNVLWDSSYGGSDGDYANYGMYDTRDSSIEIIGGTYSSDYMVTGYHGGGDMWVVKINKEGTLLWQKPEGDVTPDDGNGMCAAPGGGYIAYGGTSSGMLGGANAWVISLDNNGNEIANKIFGGSEPEHPYSIVPYLNGYVATGMSGSSTFTEGSCNINYSGAFVSYIGYWPLIINNVNENKSQLVVYPNPSMDNVRVILPEDKSGVLTISNVLGQELYSVKINVTNVYYNVSVEDWSSGLYIVKWQGADGSVVTTKLIKK